MQSSVKIPSHPHRQTHIHILLCLISLWQTFGTELTVTD